MYDLNLARILAFDIATKIPEIYKLNNAPNCLVDVPTNYYFHDISRFESFCKEALLASNPKANIHIIDDYYAEVSVIGAYYELGDDYNIIINPNKNTCWRRFALIKELCSLYTNHYHRERGTETLHRFDDYQKSLESSVHQKNLIEKKNLDDSNLDSDTFAILLACEIMIPPKYRKYTNGLIDRVRSGEMTMNDVAQSLSMPEYILQKIVDMDYYKDSCLFYEDQKVAEIINK